MHHGVMENGLCQNGEVVPWGVGAAGAAERKGRRIRANPVSPRAAKIYCVGQGRQAAKNWERRCQRTGGRATERPVPSKSTSLA